MPFTVTVEILRLVANFVDLIINDAEQAIESEFEVVANLEILRQKTVSTKDNLIRIKGVIRSMSTEYWICKIYDIFRPSSTLGSWLSR